MIHTIIAAERREAPRELAIAVRGQLHSMGERVADLKDAQILYAAEWDGKSPWIVVHKGTIADLKLAFMGWPMVTKAEWEAANPVVIGWTA